MTENLKMNENDVAKFAARVMADVYETEVSEDGELTAETFKKLGDIFSAVNLEHRAAAYVSFIEELEKRGIEYDVETFKTQPN